jgi:tetratricopeptide (TPR) repeat protein
VQIVLDTPGKRRAVLLGSLALAAVLCYQALRIWVADLFVQSDNVAKIERGANLEPGNGDAWDRLARFHLTDFSNPDPALAATDFERAVRDDPRSAHYLMDLASAYEADGDVAAAQRAWQQARKVYPASAEVEWNYGNFLLRNNQVPEGYEQIKRAVRGDVKYLPLAISRAWRASGDVNALLDQVLPSDQDAYLEALKFFDTIHQPDPAVAVWQRLMALGQPLPLEDSFPFFETLIEGNRGDQATTAWPQALAAAGLHYDPPADGQRIWNGDFSSEFIDGGLGWRWNGPLGAAIEFDTRPASLATGRSVHLEFSGGTNLDLAEPMQYVPVEPSSTYHFHALMRTEAISTESGMRFLLQDPAHPAAVLVFTENLIGSRPWTAIEADFSTGPDTHFVSVALRRVQSRLFDSKLSGSVWIADVSLLPATSGGAEPGSK